MSRAGRFDARLGRRLRRHISLLDTGSIVGLQARTKRARVWLDEHVSTDEQVWCEPRYVDDILRGFCYVIGEEYPE